MLFSIFGSLEPFTAREEDLLVFESMTAAVVVFFFFRKDFLLFTGVVVVLLVCPMLSALALGKLMPDTNARL